ncbi:MAG: hypothetical protein Q9187_006556 [Circinaria calcarea]
MGEQEEDETLLDGITYVVDEALSENSFNLLSNDFDKYWRRSLYELRSPLLVEIKAAFLHGERASSLSNKPQYSHIEFSYAIMEKIKNLLLVVLAIAKSPHQLTSDSNPGGKHDDEVLYGSGQSSDPVHSGNNAGSGQGGHLDSSRTAGHDNNPLSSNTDNSATGTSDYDNNPATTARSVGKEGLAGSSGLGSSNTLGSGTREPRIPGAFDHDDDASSTTAIRSGVPGHGASGLSDPLNINKPLPHEPGSSPLGSASSTTVGPHSADVGNKLDPRVDSNLDGSRGLGRSTGTIGSELTGSTLPDRTVGNFRSDNNKNTSLGRDTATGAGGLEAAGAAHHHGVQSSDPKTSSTGTQGRSFPLGGHNNTTSGTALEPHDSSLPNRADPRVNNDRDGSQQTGIVDTGLSGYGPETWEHRHGPYGHQYEGDPCQREPPVPGPHFVQGPHATDTANLLDPHVAGTVIPPGSTAATGTGTGIGHGHHHEQSNTGTGIGSTTHEHDSQRESSHLGRDAAIGAAGVSYEADRGHPSSTSHEHENQRGGHHLGRDAAIGAAGLSYGADHSHPSSSIPTTTDSASATHKPSLMDRITGKHTDTAHKSTDGGISSLGHSEPHHTSGLDTRLESQPRENTESGKLHHYGRDVAGGGAIGAAGYEAEKHHHDREAGHDHPVSLPVRETNSTAHQAHKPSLLEKLTGKHHETNEGPVTGATSAPTSGVPPGIKPGTASSFGHLEDHSRTEKDIEQPSHFGKGALGVGTVGAASYKAEKHHRNKEDIPRTSGLSGTTAGSGYDQQSRLGHGLGRDTALVGGTGTAIGAEKHHHSGEYPTSTTSSSTRPSVYDDRDVSGTHYKRDAALGAGAVGAGAVGAGAAGSKFSKKEAEKEAKHYAKEEAKFEKELEKEHKHHEKELQKEHKAQEKEHEKVLQKEHKAHEKEHEKEDHDKKKHGGGLFGFLHRKKSDKELKEEEAARTGTSHHSATGAGTTLGVNQGPTASFGHFEDHTRTEADLEQPTAGTTSGVGATEHGHHERNRLHKDPPASLLQAANTKYAEAPQSGYASQVTGGTGTTALAQGHDYKGETGDRGVEPHTGFPIDYSKGDGSFGTDDTPVPHHHHGASTSGAPPGAMGTAEHGSTLPGESTRPGGTFDSSKVNSSYPGAPGTNDGYEAGHVPHRTPGTSGAGTGGY